MNKQEFVKRLETSGVIVTKNGGAYKPLDLIVNSEKARADLKIIQQIRRQHGA